MPDANYVFVDGCLSDVPEGMRPLRAFCETCGLDMLMGCPGGVMPSSISCPGCNAEIVLYKCFNCGVGYDSDWDQAFMELAVPFGSTLDDGSAAPPILLCSTKCLLGAVKDDDFNAKGMFGPGPGYQPDTDES